MEIKRLRAFRAGTVTAAAEQLHIAQPALSRQLHRLEQELGLTLFDRAGPRLRLTSAGRQLVAIATDLVARADQVESVAQHLAHGTLRRVEIAAAETTVHEVLAPFVATLTPAGPFVAIRDVEAESVHAAVAEGADLGVAAVAPPVRHLAWRPLTDVPVRAYVSIGHPWAVARRDTVTIAELVTEPLILPAMSDPLRGVLDAVVARAGLAYQRVEESATARMSQALAAAGFGVAIVSDLPRFGAYPVLIEAADGSAVRLHLHACWPERHYAAAALASLIDALSEFAATYVHQTAWETGLGAVPLR